MKHSDAAKHALGNHNLAISDDGLNNFIESTPRPDFLDNYDCDAKILDTYDREIILDSIFQFFYNSDYPCNGTPQHEVDALIKKMKNDNIIWSSPCR